MAIDYRLRPQTLSPAYNEMMFVMSSTNGDEENFSYILDIQTNGVKTSEIKVYNNPDGYGVVDIHRHLENSVKFDLDHTDTNIVRPAPNSYVDYRVDGYESYFIKSTYNSMLDLGGYVRVFLTNPGLVAGDEVTIEITQTVINPNGNVVVPQGTKIRTTVREITSTNSLTLNLSYADYGYLYPGILYRSDGATTKKASGFVSGRLAFNGAIPWVDVPNWDFNVYKLGDANGKLLTTLSNESTVRVDDRIWLNWFNGNGLNSTSILVETNRGRFYLDHGILPNTPNSKISQIGVGPWNLINTTTTVNEVPGQQQFGLPMFDDNTTEYTVSFGSESSAAPGPVYNVIDVDPYNNFWTEFETDIPHGYSVGDAITLDCPSVSRYNGDFVIFSVFSPTEFIVYMDYDGNASDVTVREQAVYNYGPPVVLLAGSYNAIGTEFLCQNNHGFSVGQEIEIFNSGSYDGVTVVTALGTGPLGSAIFYADVPYTGLSIPSGAEAKAILPGDGSTITPASETYTFKIDRTCHKFDNYKLMYLDPLGSFLTVNFELSHTKNIKTKKTNYRQNYGSYDATSNTYGYNSFDRGNTRLDTDITETYDVTTNWVDEEQGSRVIELLKSPEVYHLKDDGALLAIDITTSSMEQKQKVREKLFNYSVKFKYSHKDTVQRG